jgi:phytoene synthase
MTPALHSSYAYCAGVARREARNFYPGFLLLPADRRRSMCALYAFLRRSDDIGDDTAVRLDERREMLNAWRQSLGSALEGYSTPDSWHGWPALADTAERHAIPARLLQAVLDGVSLDLESTTFETADDLDAYCDLVASAVGLCCLHIWGFRSDGGRAELLAECTGRALQLTNILRDVKEDAENGRVYLPQTALRRFGVTFDDLTAPNTASPLRELLASMAERAYRYYDQGRPLMALVDPVGRPVLGAIVGIYRALLDQIARSGYDVLARRTRVPSWRKGAIAVRALSTRFVWHEARTVEAPPVR